jgi:pyruvate dehydrogenase E2 component (dihydrolipoamide acetyltransferase)
MATEIKLQALKENVDSVEVNAVKVAPGDEVAEGQPLLEVQADKASLEVPSPVAGRIAEMRVSVGDVLNVGQVYCLVEASDKARQPVAKKQEETPAPQTSRDAPGADGPPSPAAPARDQADANGGTPQVLPSGLPPASPGTRRLAREWGVDLTEVAGSARGGRIVEEDIKGHVRQLAAGDRRQLGAPSLAPPLPDFSRWGPVERTSLSPVRRAVARQMSLAWSQVPHVTQHDLADITDLEAFRKEQAGKGPKLTVTAFALKACAVLLREFPQFNASLDTANNQLVLKRYYHLGVAVDTAGGLLVPVIHHVDRKSIHELAAELGELAERARQRKLDSEQMQGGTFTITNLGGIGGSGFTPIVNYPEVAILGLSRGRQEATFRDGQVVPRLMLPLSLSYDHRVIDGADAARFTRRLAELLAKPLLMLLQA